MRDDNMFWYLRLNSRMIADVRPPKMLMIFVWPSLCSYNICTVLNVFVITFTPTTAVPGI